MRGGLEIAVVIPALNEERTIASVVASIPDWVDDIVVVDNGSTDATAAIARHSGARVVAEERRGYGAACRRGFEAARERLPGGAPLVIVFIDGDLSDDPGEMGALVDPLARGDADFVVGSRALGSRERGALSPQQRVGNDLSCALIRVLFGARYTDLGPFRAIGADDLESLDLDDLGFGWTIQMQIRAARRGLRIIEVPVRYRRRAAGASKVSGTLRGVVGAGAKFMYVIFGEAAKARLDRSKQQKYRRA